MEFRPLRHPADAAAVGALLEAAAAADGHPALSEEKHQDYVAGATRGRGIVGEEGGVVLGYVHLLPRRGTGWQVEMALAPEARSAAAYRELAEAAVAEVGHGEVARVWAFSDDQAEALAEMGLECCRELRQMRRPLPAPDPALPVGMELRAFEPGRDEDAWLAAHNAAFEFGDGAGWTIADLEGRTARDWFDPAGMLLAWDGADLAGYCWTKVHPGRVGEIYVVGITPRHQGRDLGSALVLAGLKDLAERRGCTTGMLYVHQDNDPALRLYRRLGFATARVDRSFSFGPRSAQPNR